MTTPDQPQILQQTSTVHIGNLSWQATEDDLIALLRELGFHSVVSVRIIQDRDTGRSRGFAFVELSDHLAAGEVCAALDGHDYRGRVLSATPAKLRPPQSR